MSNVRIELERCVIRSWKAGDVESLARHANNREVWKNLADSFPHPYTQVHAQEWISLMRDAAPQTHFAIEVAGDAVGGIGYGLKKHIYRHSAQVGYWIGEEHWGKGIATEALAAITHHAFSNHDLRRVYAIVLDWNPASMKVLRKCGYRREARMREGVTKDGVVLDSFMYAILREDVLGPQEDG